MRMKKIKSGLLAGLMTLAFTCSWWGKGLKDIAQPELGTYECTEARLGNIDYLERFSYIRLELKAGGELVLHYAERDGEGRQAKGEYAYDREKGTLTLTGGNIRREFPLAEGVLTVAVRVGAQTLSLTFEQK